MKVNGESSSFGVGGNTSTRKRKIISNGSHINTPYRMDNNNDSKLPLNTLLEGLSPKMKDNALPSLPSSSIRSNMTEKRSYSNRVLNSKILHTSNSNNFLYPDIGGGFTPSRNNATIHEPASTTHSSRWDYYI